MMEFCAAPAVAALLLFARLLSSVSVKRKRDRDIDAILLGPTDGIQSRTASEL